MSKKIVAIIGKPNVGKSTLFNRIVGNKRSIVDDKPGVTRDRIYAEAEWQNHNFILIDTGGIEASSKEMIPKMMREQAEIAIETADLILFVLDGKTGLTHADEEVADILRKVEKNILLVINKIDGKKLPDNYYDFYSLGLGEPINISAANMLGLGDLLDKMINSMDFSENDDLDDEKVKISIIGKPNVGKSSLLNALTGENRAIVSPIPGTTRDSLDTDFIYNDKEYVLIDTAGIRRKNKIKFDIERFSVIRSMSSIERSDVCLLLIDAEEGVTEQDKRIAGLAFDAGKGIILIVNKWDLIEKDTKTVQEFKKKIQSELVFIDYAPILFISAKTGKRVDKIMEVVEKVYENCSFRVKTGVLNELIADAIMMKSPPSDKGKALKIYYATQVGVKPPLFTFKINDRELMHFSYSRYLENKIREGFDFSGTPIKFVLREKGENEDV